MHKTLAGVTYRVREGSIQLPAELQGYVVAVLGLDNRPQAKPHFRVLGELDAATAQAAKAAAQAETQKLGATGINITELPNLADGAAFLGGSYAVSGQTFNISSIDVLKGTIFFGFNDLALNQPAPTSAAMQAQAQIVLGRLP